MWRKTILATAIVGAGLTSTTGMAFAGEDNSADNVSDNTSHHDGSGKHEDGHGKHEAHGNGCGNDVQSKNGENAHQKGIFNAKDVQTIVPGNICGNDVPVNVLGVQVPIQHASGNAPIGSPAEDNSGSSAQS